MRVAKLAVSAFLVPAMLLLGVPAWKHAHPAGDRPHRHHHAHHHDHDGPGESHAHMHVNLFGIEFALPVDQRDDDSDEPRPTTFIAATPLLTLAPLHSHFIGLAQPIAAPGQPVRIAPLVRRQTTVVAPLCDTARHERSGVQLT
jgi:hypothetical protein